MTTHRADVLTAVVVGGAISGLTATVALARAGWKVRLLERSPSFGEIGAGLGVAGNGMAALAALGLGDAVRAVGHEVHHAGFQDLHGRWLLRLPDRSDVRRSTTFWGLHRRRLHHALLTAAEQFDSVDLVHGARVTGVHPGVVGHEPATVTWVADTGGATEQSALVVAADGIRSVVRTQLFPESQPQYAGATSWRAIVGDTDHDDGYIESWGPGTSFGSLRISATEVYWYGDVQQPVGSTFADEQAAARHHFADWSPQVRALVAATTSDQLIRNDIYHLPGGAPRYVRGRVTLIGDAAHAMVPNSGQGSATAIEDGLCVGRMIAEPIAAGAAMMNVMVEFDRVRRRRCRRIARQGLLLARLGDGVPAGRRQSIRNAVLRRIPPVPMIKAGARAVHWSPPADGANEIGKI